MSDSEEDVLDYDEEAPEVELGFVCDDPVTVDAKPLHCEPDWTKWDGGQIGGRPSWLVPSTSGIPSTEQLQCVECHSPLSFLLQIYCPLDELEDAFHRSLRSNATEFHRDQRGPLCTVRTARDVHMQRVPRGPVL